ncbi:MAG: transcriptional regulator, partial [Acetobacteraceae bacterium]
MASDDILERAVREPRPSPIDVHVGTRVRLRRTLLGMSQE